ncbi:putative ATP-dependent RNA helicase spindle-E isoform 2-T2 [Cochliomyia hominivorax]
MFFPTILVPQYILDDAYRRREYCKIVCTQPRRIAAISICRRVSAERKWKEGSVVGYQVGLHANSSEDTRLLFCTTGVLLQQLIKNKTLAPYTHIILDEVHERDQDMDFLLIIVRRLLVTNSKHVKIILMSATIDTKMFSNYFRVRKYPAPVIKTDSRRLFQVKEFYLCDLDRINNFNAKVSLNDPGISAEMYNLALKLLIVIDNIEKQDAVFNTDPDNDENHKKSILIFLPGINEIEYMCKKLEQLKDTDNNQVRLCPIRLHSVISPDEQIRVFNRPPPGYRKVILATNIAESSITVPDVKYVIDFCLTKLLVTDTSTNFTKLEIQWASRANLKQRAGRAGRVMNGRVYRLIPRSFYDNFLEDFSKPEMLRCPLESVVLKSKLLEMGSPPYVLALAMSPPNLRDIHNTVITLKEVGALYKYTNGEYMIDDGDITYMGRIMAFLPLDARLTRLIMMGYAFSALEESIIIAAGLSVRSIFKFQSFKRNGEINAYIKKLSWADGSGSDLMAILNAYRKWITLKHDESFDDIEYTWANQNYINIRSIREMHLLVKDIKDRLNGFGIKETNRSQFSHWQEWEKTIMLKVIIAGAFYPNYFVYNKQYDMDKERTKYHILCGHNPCRTVYFTNFDTRHIGQLYTRSIKELFKDVHINPKNIDISFQSNSERVLVIFKNDPEIDDNEFQSIPTGNDINDNVRIKMPGAVCTEVYKALRMRHLNIPTIFNVMDSRAGVKFAEDHGLGVMCDGAWRPTKRLLKNAELVVLPSVFQKNISGYITHIENCSKFFFQPLSEMERMQEIQDMLNNPEDIENCKFPSNTTLAAGMILSAPFENKYHRARVIKTIEQTRHHKQIKVFFIDYGNVSTIDFHKLRYFSERTKTLADIPPRLFECRLAMIEPSAVRSSNEEWTDEAMELVQEYADTGIIEIEVYSVMDGIANVIIKKDNSTLNEILVEKGLARTSDESYMSKSDHDFRIRKQSIANRFLDEDSARQNEEYLRSIRPEIDMDIEPPPKHLCNKTLKLRGPFSPIEINLFSAIRAGTWKSVSLERDSVNFIQVDSNPKDMYERLVVAANITESPNGDGLVARATTLMPNIHGFGALMTLLFCPTMQIKCNKTQTKYVAILAGLGYDEITHKSQYSDHDIVFYLDIDILPDDLELINQIRYSMDTLFHTKSYQERPNLKPGEINDLTTKIKHIVLRLLSKNRKYIEVHVGPNDNKWEYLDPNEIIEPTNIYDKRSLFPPHSIMRLYEEKYDSIHALNMHCHELHRKRQYDGSIPATTCRLCHQPIENIVQLRIHLLSQLHRDREHQIRFQPQPI